eukprot:1615627-Rhodomonas_salina.1
MPSHGVFMDNFSALAALQNIENCALLLRQWGREGQISLQVIFGGTNIHKTPSNWPRKDARADKAENEKKFAVQLRTRGPTKILPFRLRLLEITVAQGFKFSG